MKYLIFLVLFLSDQFKPYSHHTCRGPASNVSCEYFYDLVNDTLTEEILALIRKTSLRPVPKDYHAKPLFQLYGHFKVNILGVPIFKDNFMANTFVYTDENGEEVVGYRDNSFEDNEKEQEDPDYYAHNKFAVDELTKAEGVDFVKYESYYNIMRFNVKALEYNQNSGGQFVLTYDLLQPNVFSENTMQVGELKFRVAKVNDEFQTFYLDEQGNEHRFTSIYLEAPNRKPLNGLTNLILFNGTEQVMSIPAAEKVKANRSLKL